MNKKTLIGLGMTSVIVPAAFGAGMLSNNFCNAEEYKNVRENTNIVTVLADDLAYFDVVCMAGNHNADGESYYEAPNIQRLAREGMTFTNAHAFPVCSPTRASMISGQYTDRVGFYNATGDGLPSDDEGFVCDDAIAPSYNEYLGKASRRCVDINERSYADEFKDNGYFTAYFGKNHTGNVSMGERGFDYDFSCNVSGPAAYYPIKSGQKWTYGTNMGNFNFNVVPGEHVADRMAREAKDFIDLAVEKDRAFMMTYAEFDVHAPFQAKKEYVEYFKNKNVPDDPRNGKYMMATMIKALDDAVGVLMDTLEENGILDNTMFSFVADNGGNHYNQVSSDITGENMDYVTEMYPLRGGKGTNYEGGTREPLVIRYPKLIKPGTYCVEPVSIVDFYPTILDVAGISAKEGKVLDGLSIKPLFSDPESSLPRPGVFTNWARTSPASCGTPSFKINTREWVLLYNIETYGGYLDRYELYHLPTDIAQAHNLADKYPQKVEELYSYIEEHLRGVVGGVLTKNPNYNKNYDYEKDGLPLFIKVRQSEIEKRDKMVAEWEATGKMTPYINAIFNGEINYSNNDSNTNDKLRDIIILQENSSTAYLRSLPKQLGINVEEKNGKVTVPADLILKNMLYKLTPSSTRLKAQYYDNIIELDTEKQTATVNGKSIPVSGNIVCEKNRFYMTIDDFAQVMGKKVVNYKNTFYLADNAFDTEQTETVEFLDHAQKLYDSAKHYEDINYLAVDFGDKYSQVMSDEQYKKYLNVPELNPKIEPISFDFTKGEDFQNWVNTKENSTMEIGNIGPDGEHCLKFVASAHDAQLTNYNLNVDTDKYNYLRITYRNLSYGNRTQIWWSEKNGTFIDKACINMSTKLGTENYETIYIPMEGPQWSGIVNYLRIDPIDTSMKGAIYIKEIAFVAGTQKVDFDFTDGLDGFEAVSGTITHENGAVTYTGNNMNQAHIRNLHMNFDADVYRYLNVTYKNTSDNSNLIVFFKRKFDTKFETSCLISTSGMAQNNDEYVTYSLDMTKNENWAGKMTGLRVSIQGPNPGSVTFDKIWLSNEPVKTEIIEKNEWNFDKGVEGFEAFKGTITHENGAVTYTGDDMNQAHIRNLGINVNADNHKYLNITYKNSTTNGNLVVFFKRESDKGFVSDCLIQTNGMAQNNSEYVTYSLDMTKNENWKGKMIGLRVSIQGPNPGCVTFDKIWFSNEPVKTEIIEKTEWAFDENVEGFEAFKGTITHENGAVTYTGDDMNQAHIRNLGINVNADNYKYLNITYKNSTLNDNLVVFFKRENDTKFEEVCFIHANGMIQNNVEYVTYSLDMTKNENWTGKIVGIRVSIQGPNPGSVTFDKIWFSNEPVNTVKNDKVA